MVFVCKVAVRRVIEMVRSVKKGPWLINYEVHGSKVVKIIYTSKSFEKRGWTYPGGDNDDSSFGRS